jgi:hypothetical protein
MRSTIVALSASAWRLTARTLGILAHGWRRGRRRSDTKLAVDIYGDRFISERDRGYDRQ